MPDFLLDIKGLEPIQDSGWDYSCSKWCLFRIERRGNVGGGRGKWMWEKCNYAFGDGFDSFTSREDY